MSGETQALDGRVILQVLPALRVGGAERGSVDIARAIVAAGGRALVAAENGPLAAELAATGAEFIRLPMASKNPLIMAANIGRLVRLIGERGVDLVHARSRAPAWSALAAARLCRRPFITTFHARYHAESGPKRLYNSVMARGARIIAISSFIAGHIRTAYPWAADRVRVVPRGIDLTRFDPERVTAARVDALRRVYGLDGDSGSNPPPPSPPPSRPLSRPPSQSSMSSSSQPALPLILMPARLSRLKGQDLLLRALTRMTTGAHCLLVGPDGGGGGFRAELGALIATLGLEDRVTLADTCTDMPAAYRMATAAVVASTEPEGFGRVAVEAQAMGCPVVAVGLGALPELIDDGVTGWLVPTNNPDALATALDRALTLTDTERQTLTATAIARVRSAFGMDSMTAATLAVYGELLGRGGGAG